jgi:NADPH-dependent curcumin reductase
VYQSALSIADALANGSTHGSARTLTNRRVVLRSRPLGPARVENFAVEDRAVPVPSADQVLLRTLYLSLDPYCQAGIDDAVTDEVPVRVGQVMAGNTVSRVEASRQGNFAEGDLVLACGGWQQYALSDGADLIRLSTRIVRPTQFLGPLGLPGFLAYLALCKIARPKVGETVVVSAASGAVGSLAGQIAKLMGCRAVVLAGAADKRRFGIEEPGFDACIERRAPDLEARLRAACPNGIDVYFENAGGAVFETVLPLLNKGARVPLRGTICGSDGTDSSDKTVRLWYVARSLAAKRIKMQAFIAADHRHRYGEFVQQMSHWLDSGKVRFREDIVDGLENAARAFVSLLEGSRFGRLVIRVANR